ncbi:DUF6702 family protein [Agarilytica rhodophyticola]|uniref:DUF6702 family protein n=1 Tax=Agarilytica rhodophyticola TaxID=1737490 RepID=UPI001C1F8186|nr:DUF6702 family protein [Agarilytica rhodophyticola]
MKVSTSKNNGVIWLSCLLMCMLAISSHGHQQKQTISTLLFNQRTGNIEVAHRFYIHDAEHAIKLVVDKKADIIRSEASQRAFGDYVQKHFKLSVQGDNALPLNYVGHEVEGKFFWVYQEVKIPTALKQLNIYNNMLREVWKSQHNLVNVEGRGKRQSVEFFGDDEWKTLKLSQN